MNKQSSELVMRLEAVINTAIDGIITINTNGIVESMNPAAARMFGYEVDEMIGQKVNHLMNTNDAHHHDQYIENYLETKVPKIIGIGREVSARKKDGTEFPCRLAVSEVILNDRIIFTGILHDLSAVKKAQEEVEKLNKELELKVQERTNELEIVVNQLLKTNDDLATREVQLNEALQKERELGELKSRFVSMASHEFRTPLSTILSSASIIAKYNSDTQQPQRERHITKIKRAVDNLTGILNDFLSLSKLEEGQQKADLVEVDLISICKDVKEDLSGILKQGQSIQMEAPEELVIISDERTLRNVFFNLLSNAIKYSEKDVHCNVKVSGSKVVLKIRDEGIGIPLEDQKYIFTRFFRAQNVENIQGTGLGLNIVKRYLELLGGDITFESVPSEGTEFTINLPANVKEDTGH